MMKTKLLFIFLFVVVVAGTATILHLKSCNRETNTEEASSGIPETIAVYRFGSFPERKAKKLANAIKEYFPNVIYNDRILELPPKYYNKERNRYEGTGLFGILSNIRGENAAIGLTDYVIFKPNNISKTFGIMGVAPINRYICVVSDKIPRGGMTQKEENFLKLALHELGHSFGLPHCPDQHCFMVDAEHKTKLPQSNYFCPKCRNHLNKKGWCIKE